MNRQEVNHYLKLGYSVDLKNGVYMFKSNGIKSKYPKNTYVVRVADREFTSTNFREAYSFAYNEQFSNYVSIGSNYGLY